MSNSMLQMWIHNHQTLTLLAVLLMVMCNEGPICNRKSNVIAIRFAANNYVMYIFDGNIWLTHVPVGLRSLLYMSKTSFP